MATIGAAVAATGATMAAGGAIGAASPELAQAKSRALLLNDGLRRAEFPNDISAASLAD